MTQPVYGPDMFAMDLDLPDPETVLNPAMPRAWSAGGVIESVKTAVVMGVRDAFRRTTMQSSQDEGEPFHVSIEYPVKETEYPGIWVQFAIEQLQRAGLSMEHWTKDDRGEWGPIQTWAFNGRITLTIAALTSKDRDRLADTVIAQLAFSRPPDLIITNPRKDAKQMKGLLGTINDNPFVQMTLNTDIVNSGGATVTGGTPWAQNILLYEDNYSIACTGHFNIRFSYDGVYELREIRQDPTIEEAGLLYDPRQWGSEIVVERTRDAYPIGHPGQYNSGFGAR
jgi:hypothetical protein